MKKSLRKAYAKVQLAEISAEPFIAYFMSESPALQTQRFRTADGRVEFEAVPFLRYRLDVGEPVLIINEGIEHGR